MFICGYMGRLTKNPELKVTQKGKQNCKFTVANEEGWGKSKRTDFIQCIAWNKTAEVVSNNFKKGDWIIVVGSWENNSYQKNEKGYDIPNWQYRVERINFIPKIINKSSDDDDYVPYSGSATQMAGVNNSAGVEYSSDEFAPISGDVEDLPFDIGLAYP